MNFITFTENLKTHEIEMKTKDREPQKEIGVALKASLKEIKKKNIATLATSEDDEELTLLLKNIKRMYHKSERRSDLRRKNKKVMEGHHLGLG